MSYENESCTLLASSFSFSFFQFSPHLHKVHMRKLKKGENIRFSKAFDQVLEAAVAVTVNLYMMVRKIVVFTDVECEKATNKF